MGKSILLFIALILNFLVHAQPPNDDCENAILAPVNVASLNIESVVGSLTGATASAITTEPVCSGNPDDDVWFKFVATATDLYSRVIYTSGDLNDLRHVIYSGSCGSLSEVYCPPGSGSGFLTGLTIGETYYVRVFSLSSFSGTANFQLIISTASTCANSLNVCGDQPYPNVTGVSSGGQMGCLFTTPNPTYLTIKIAGSGSVNLTFSQSTPGSPVPNLDSDYVAWGPFPSKDAACEAISNGLQPIPFGCGYSTNPNENLNIPNAQAGEYYIAMVTNFSNQPGFISVQVSPDSTGSIDCAGIRLNAFLDINTNGQQETGEPNFPLGEFQYEANDSGEIHNIFSPQGFYTIYDYQATNIYDLNYVVNDAFESYYSCSTTFPDIAASEVIETYNFPVTITQSYNDLAVSINPLSNPVAGSTYYSTIVYTNNGNQTITSGTIEFSCDGALSIASISQSGTTLIPNGFTYVFSDLQPFESRSITVIMNVPSIPTVSMGQLVTNNVSVTPPSGDLIASNNNSTTAQAILASYDPNDKTESHGEDILISAFSPGDYLYYTIRFENIGTAAAKDVLIVDILDQQLDETSLIMIGASHDYTLDRVGMNLNWDFKDIFLPVSVANSAIGKGYITFKIKLKPGFALGDIIANTAAIYFDSNPGIITNTWNTEFVSQLNGHDFASSNVLIFPNPANNLVQVSIDNNEILNNITVYDVLGKSVIKMSDISASQTTVDVSLLSNGIYILEIGTNSGVRQIRKLVIH